MKDVSPGDDGKQPGGAAPSGHLRDELLAAGADLARLRGDLRVQLHLARKEAEDLWAAVEPRLTRAEERLADAARKLGAQAEEARLQAHLGVAEVKQVWPGIEHAVFELVDDVRRTAYETRATLDAARVKAHLARMDAEALGAKTVTSLQRSAETVDRQTKAALEELRSAMARLRGRLTPRGDDTKGAPPARSSRDVDDA